MSGFSFRDQILVVQLSDSTKMVDIECSLNQSNFGNFIEMTFFHTKNLQSLQSDLKSFKKYAK